VSDPRIRDDLRLLAWFGARLLVLRSGPEDLPYSPALTWIAIALMASTYPAWMIVLSDTPPGSVPPTGGLLFALAVTLWYGLAMSHIWARTLDRGYALGLLMTLLMNVAMWAVPVALLIGFVEVSNLFN
jgi:hypothetical protein